MNKNYSDFTKSRIMKCFELMHAYLDTLQVEDEDLLCKLQCDILKEKIALPDGVYEKIDSFITEHFTPFVEDYETVFADIHTPEYGYYGDDDEFVVYDEKMKKFLIHYMCIVGLKRFELDQFGYSELRPFLLA